MPKPLTVAGAVEGPVDEVVLRRVLDQVGVGLYPVHIANGKPGLLHRLAGFNHAAQAMPWVVLVDLDRDAQCAPPARLKWLPEPAPLMCFRVVVRAVEAWLLADRESAADYLGVLPTRIPLDPEGLDNPKLALVAIARRSARREIREGLVPRPESGRQVGPTYTSHMIYYAQSAWRPEVAEQAADSLRRFRLRLTELS
jgi:hypothetical protein